MWFETIVVFLSRITLLVGNPRRAQNSQFELFELILLLTLDKQFSIYQLDTTLIISVNSIFPTLLLYSLEGVRKPPTSCHTRSPPQELASTPCAATIIIIINIITVSITNIIAIAMSHVITIIAISIVIVIIDTIRQMRVNHAACAVERAVRECGLPLAVWKSRSSICFVRLPDGHLDMLPV